jgi:hypothetical protein
MRILSPNPRREEVKPTDQEAQPTGLEAKPTDLEAKPTEQEIMTRSTRSMTTMNAPSVIWSAADRLDVDSMCGIIGNYFNMAPISTPKLCRQAFGDPLFQTPVATVGARDRFRQFLGSFVVKHLCVLFFPTSLPEAP